jgi:hypothetical protein
MRVQLYPALPQLRSGAQETEQQQQAQQSQGPAAAATAFAAPSFAAPSAPAFAAPAFAAQSYASPPSFSGSISRQSGASFASNDASMSAAQPASNTSPLARNYALLSQFFAEKANTEGRGEGGEEASRLSEVEVAGCVRLLEDSGARLHGYGMDASPPRMQQQLGYAREGAQREESLPLGADASWTGRSQSVRRFGPTALLCVILC